MRRTSFRILDQIGQVFRVFVPMILYFVVMWTGTFFLVYKLTRRRGGSKLYGYQMAVVQVSRGGLGRLAAFADYKRHSLPGPTSELHSLVPT